MFRTETQHALRALSVLALSPETMVLTDLSRRCLVPPPMLAKILHRLVRDGIVKGQPGPGGGYRLAVPPKAIALRRVVELIEGPQFGSRCLFGLPTCSDLEPCPLHALWAEVRGSIQRILDTQTIADLAQASAAGPSTASGVGAETQR